MLIILVRLYTRDEIEGIVKIGVEENVKLSTKDALENLVRIASQHNLGCAVQLMRSAKIMRERKVGRRLLLGYFRGCEVVRS